MGLFGNYAKEGPGVKKDEPQKWICRFCGNVHEGQEAPGICPVCKKPQAYFEVKAENY